MIGPMLFASVSANPLKVARMRKLGADVGLAAIVHRRAALPGQRVATVF